MVEAKWKETGISDKSGVKEYLVNYPYSSYLDYLIQNRPESSICSLANFPDYFEKKSFENFIDYWLEFKDTEEH
jgi:hypothetical protein